ncbi:hypothetical protein [Cylindrospermopsis raciborskii]|uniref:hypothetical protein n=1 Tax=Cylindrospermopsis raciborskii TaxID=77022 RepID=UPI000778B95F|nr:hypothetical protein [Cylindrospermopsis raciborskii]
MKSWQQRIIAFAFIGGIVMFLGQRVVYENQIVPIQQVPVDAWLASDYTNAALTIFFACLVSTLLWCALAEKSRFNDGAATARWRLLWWLLGIIPMVTIAIAVFYINRSSEAHFSLMAFFLLDAILLYWLPTATSSPEAVKYVPPLAFWLRHKLMGD